MKPLLTQDLSPTLRLMNLAERARRRIRDEMTHKHLSQQEVADLLKWTQSKVAQKLTGRTPITLEELEALAFAVSLSPTEVVRDTGLEFCAEMTPTELRVLELFRTLPTVTRDHFFGVLAFQTRTLIESKGITKAKPIIPKGRAK